MHDNYWNIAERTNGRLAMIGLFALIINYGLFGWIIPGIYQPLNSTLNENTIKEIMKNVELFLTTFFVGGIIIALSISIFERV